MKVKLRIPANDGDWPLEWQGQVVEVHIVQVRRVDADKFTWSSDGYDAEVVHDEPKQDELQTEPSPEPVAVHQPWSFNDQEVKEIHFK